MSDIRLHIVLDNLRSAFNVGSIFRTADGTGCAMIHICGISAYPPNPKLDKTGLGAIESVPWKYYENTSDAIEFLKKNDIPIWSVETAPESKDYRDVKFPKNVALVFGHEKRGVDENILQISDKIIRIPMNGKKRSLNVATVAGIIMFEAIRDIRQKTKNEKL